MNMVPHRLIVRHVRAEFVIRLQATGNHCTVHNTLRLPPETNFRVDEELQ